MTPHDELLDLAIELAEHAEDTLGLIELWASNHDEQIEILCDLEPAGAPQRVATTVRRLPRRVIADRRELGESVRSSIEATARCLDDLLQAWRELRELPQRKRH